METIQIHGIAGLLVKNGILDEIKASEYQKLADRQQQTLLHYLIVDLGFSGATIASIIAHHFGIPLFDLHSLNLKVIQHHILTKELIAQYNVIPIFLRENNLFLATDDPSQYLALKNIQFHTELHCQLIIVETDKLHQYLNDLLKTKDNQDLVDNEDVSIIKFVDNILIKAIKRRASDIHFEPYDQFYRIRYRIDGVLIEAANPPSNVARRITARIKILSNLDPTERRLPQDGRFKTDFLDLEATDIRVSTCPTIAGEKVVLRILTSQNMILDIAQLGLNFNQEKIFTTTIKLPQGIIIVTGPTGSGKTITLYTALNRLNSLQSNLTTIEDPIEIKLSGINQVQVNNKIGLTFARTLRALLRQDPDIIMLGEIRDSETATLAIQAAQTGHLVLTTLHANSAVDTISRLTSIGVPYFNIAHSVVLIIAQRLVRKLCMYCKRPCDQFAPAELVDIGFSQNAISDLLLYEANGCNKCHYGYKGRIGIFELMPISTAIMQLILAKANALEILKQAKYDGMLSLYQSGLEKVKSGLTSLAEIQRVTTR